MRLFRIERKNLYRLWAWSTLSSVVVFVALALLDASLRNRTGLGTADLQQFSTAAQYQAALAIWIRSDFALRAGFNLHTRGREIEPETMQAMPSRANALIAGHC